MAPRQRNGKRSLRVVFVSREEQAERTKIAKIASVLGMESPQQVRTAAIELLSLAAGFAEKHGSQHVVLGAKRNMVYIFSDPEDSEGA